jgi:hypothetical protein
MNIAQRLVGLLAIAGLAAIVLYAPRRVPLLNDIVHPFLLGDSLAVKFPVSWPLAVVYAGCVIVVAGLVSFLVRRSR